MTRPADRLVDDGLAVFLFHGVVRRCDHPVRNYTHKHLTDCMFAGVIRSLVCAGTPVSMDQVIDAWDGHEPLPPRAFAVTFDDGFENNASVAVPILEAHEVPATFYITSGFVEHGVMSWIDRLEYCLETARPGRLRLPWADAPVLFDTAADRIRILDEIRTRAKADAAIDRDALVSDVFAQCRVEDIHTSDDALDRKLTWEQVRELARHPLFSVGGHSHTHATLGFLPPAVLQAEIDTSLHLLDTRAGVRPRHYSYPEGLDYCFSPAVIGLLKARGVRCCPTAIDGVNDRCVDLFHLRRITVTPIASEVEPAPALASTGAL